MYIYSRYGPYRVELERKPRSVMVAMTTGTGTGYAIKDLEARGTLFIGICIYAFVLFLKKGIYG